MFQMSSHAAMLLITSLCLCMRYRLSPFVYFLYVRCFSLVISTTCHKIHTSLTLNIFLRYNYDNVWPSIVLLLSVVLKCVTTDCVTVAVLSRREDNAHCVIYVTFCIAWPRKCGQCLFNAIYGRVCTKRICLCHARRIRYVLLDDTNVLNRDKK